MADSQVCGHVRRHAEGPPYRLVCARCGAEVFPRGYWPDGPLGETIVLDPHRLPSMVWDATDEEWLEILREEADS